MLRSYRIWNPHSVIIIDTGSNKMIRTKLVLTSPITVESNKILSILLNYLSKEASMSCLV